MKKLMLSLLLLFSINLYSFCQVSNEEVLQNEALKRLEIQIINDIKNKRKDQIIKLITLTKTSGVLKNINGQSVYIIYCDMSLQFIADGWLKGNMFEGYWRDGPNVYPSQPDLVVSGEQNLYTTKLYQRGAVVLLGCEAIMVKMGNGYSVSNFSIKTEKNNRSQEISNNSSQNQTNPSINFLNKSTTTSSIPAFSGLISLDSSQAIISIVFSSIEDEIGNDYELKNKIIEALKSNKKINEINSSGVDTATIITRYLIDCNIKTFYTSKVSYSQTVYTADLRLSLYLWELDKTGRKIKGTPADNRVIKMKESFLGGAYVSKQGAFDALLPKIEQPLYEIIFAFFPINATLIDITEANKKGDPKKVKISCGIKQGVFKGSKFKILDPSRKDEEYDLQVTDLFDDYAICKVENNESIIATRFNAKDNIRVTTIYKLNK